jgi:hypothetical protein
MKIKSSEDALSVLKTLYNELAVSSEFATGQPVDRNRPVFCTIKANGKLSLEDRLFVRLEFLNVPLSDASVAAVLTIYEPSILNPKNQLGCVHLILTVVYCSGQFLLDHQYVSCERLSFCGSVIRRAQEIAGEENIQ